MSKKEIWKDVPGYEGFYQVSSIGRVKSLKKDKTPGSGNIARDEMILRASPGSCGYCVARLHKGGHEVFKVHQLVAMAFLGYTRDGTTKICVDHKNNVKTDNRLENLQLISNRENCSKDARVGTSKYTGVHWEERRKRWMAKIYICGKSKFLGYFTNEKKAGQAYKTALKELLA